MTLRSYKLFRTHGFDVKIHSSFFILLAIIFLLTYSQADLGTALFTTLLIIMLFACVLLHELGHSLMTIKYGGKVNSIVLFPLGGVSQIEEFQMTPWQEIAMSGIGPLINFGIGGLLLLWVGNPFAVSQAQMNLLTFDFFILQLMWLNFLIGFFNLLPVFPMDGGRIFKALLSLKMEQTKAIRVAATVGQVASSVMAGLGLFYNPWLAIIGLFLFFAASAEKARVNAPKSEQEG